MDLFHVVSRVKINNLIHELNQPIINVGKIEKVTKANVNIFEQIFLSDIHNVFLV